MMASFSFKQCLKLCIPALIVAVVLRVSLLVAVPEAYYGADSNSYFYTTKELHHRGKITLPTKRRYIYPILLTAVPLLPANTAQVAAVAQHLLGLGVVVGVGWIAGNLVRRPNLWVPLVALATAIWPRMLWYEHELIAEALLVASMVLALAMAFPLGCLKDPRRLFWFLVCAGLIIAVKPHGKPFWLALVIYAMCKGIAPRLWPRKCWAAVGVSVVIAATAGSDSERSWLFLNTTLPLLRTEGEPWSEYRAILKPAVEEARADMANYVFKPTYKKKLNSRDPGGVFGPAWAELVNDEKKYEMVAKRLGVEAVLAHPFKYAHIVMLKIAIVVSEGQKTDKLEPAVFWREQESNNNHRWREKPDELELLYEMKESDYRQMVEERRTRSFWCFDALERIVPLYAMTVAEPGARGGAPHIRLTWLGWLVALGCVALLRPKQFWAGVLIILPTALYLVGVYGIGDAVSRYVLPVEWIGFLLAVVGLDFLALRLERLRRAPAPELNPSH